MSKLAISEVVFNSNSHTYRLGDKTLYGITGLLKRQLFADKYKGIPAHILADAAARGSYIHSQLECEDMFGMADDIQEVANYRLLKTEYQISPLANEYLVSDNEHFATMIDMVDIEHNLYDFKTTSSLDKEYLSWQLSCGAYLFELQNDIKVGKLFAIWLRGDICELVEVERIPSSLVKELMEADTEGYQFDYTLASKKEPANVAQLIELDYFLTEVEAKQKELKQKKDELMAMIKKEMEANGTKSIETDKIKITITPASTRKSFDSKKFQSEEPELYEKYIKESKVASSIRLTVRKND